MIFFTGEVRFALADTEVFSEISNFTIYLHTHNEDISNTTKIIN